MRARLLGALWALGVSACASSPALAPTLTSIPAQWTPAGEIPREPLPMPELEQWWTRFGDPTLDALVDAVLRANFDLASARARVEAARALVRARSGERLPALAGGISAARERASLNAGIGRISDQLGVPRTKNDFALGFDLDWDLDLSGCIARRIDGARAQLDLSAEDFSDRQRQLIALTLLGYLDLRHAQAQRASTVALADSWRVTQRLAESRARAGLASALDVHSARSETLAHSADLAHFDEAIEASIHRLAVLAGDPPDAWRERLLELLPIPTPPTALPLDAPLVVLARRPDVRRADAAWRIAAARRAEAQAERWPRLTLNAVLGLASTSTGDWLAADSSFAGASASLLAPLFQGGRLDAAVDAATAMLTAEAADLNAALLHALEEVESARNAIAQRTDAHAHRAAEWSERQAAERLVRARHGAGRASRVPELSAQREAIDAERNMIAARAELCAAYVRAYTAIGAGPWAVSAAAR